MAINIHPVNHLQDIRAFLQNHLTNSDFEKSLTLKIVENLHTKGKIFSNEENAFSWGLFLKHLSALTHDQESQRDSFTAIAGAIELLILATDIVDEITDGDYNLMETMTLTEAITISNALLIDAFDLILKHTPSNTHTVVANVFHLLKMACNGQWKDLKLVIGSNVPSEHDYFEVIKQKSASLIQLVCVLAHPKQPHLLANAATNIGIAGQLKNDANDIFVDSKTDLIRKKATLPVIKAIEFSLETDNGLLIKKIQNLKEQDAKLKEEIRNYIRKTGAIDYCLILSKLYMQKAIQELYELFPDRPAELKTLELFLKD